MSFRPEKYLSDGRYDVGLIVRDVSDWYLKVGPPNRWTRVEVGKLLLALDQLTDRLAIDGGAGVAHGVAVGTGIVTPMPAQWQADFSAWQDRLAAYKKTTREVPQGHSHALWNGVGMPLLLGYYADEEQQRTADLATPFSLANQLEVGKEWRAERLRLFKEELGQAAKLAGYGLGAVAAALVVGFVASFFWGRS